MADTLPSPSESRSSTPADTAKTDTLAERLDALLEHYLELLHQYTTLREELSKTFSSGFFSLAQAQRSSTLGAGRRYGEECYDERMKAQRKACWETVPDTLVFNCKMKKDEQVSDAGTGNEKSGHLFISETKGNPEHEAQDDAKQEKIDAVNDLQILGLRSPNKKSKQNPACRDPLTWFGILVPPALRQTQAQFVKVVECQIPELLTVEAQMKFTEQRIWTLRDQLGILAEYERLEVESDEAIKNIQQHMQDAEQPTNGKQPKKASRHVLTSRPAHSRTQIVKLDG